MFSLFAGQSNQAKTVAIRDADYQDLLTVFCDLFFEDLFDSQPNCYKC